MNSNHVIIATLLTVVGVTGWQLRELQNAGISEAAPRAAAAAPLVEPAPSLRPAAPPQTGIGSIEMWNLKPSATPLNLPSLKDLFKPFYTLSKTGRFESITRSDRPKEQWQFQGVLARADGSYRALIYNSELKRLKNLGPGDLVDERLAVRRVGADNVTLEVVGEKKPQRFELRLFNANKESYVAKRKTR